MEIRSVHSRPSLISARLMAALQKKDWKSTAEHCQKALALNPTSLDTRQLLISCYIRLGDQTRSKAELEILLGLSPEPDRMRRWFEEQPGK